jgi:hypothetical protein
MRQPALERPDETETKKAEKPVKNGDFRPEEAERAERHWNLLSSFAV